MNIYYQGILGSYSYMASKIVQQTLDIEDSELIGVTSFDIVRENINDKNIGVLPIENSYAGSIHQNLYKFLRYDFEVIGEVVIDINHCILSKETDLKKIKKVYSHPQGLSQCYNFLKKNNITPIEYTDTATAAKMVSESSETSIGAIASEMAGESYGLNIIEKGIQDQLGNRTRFFVIKSKELNINYPKKNGKITVVFETKNIPAALYKCLGGFATNGINLTKIESLPSLKNPFTYIFWVDFEGDLSQVGVQNALEELKVFSENFKILGEY